LRPVDRCSKGPRGSWQVLSCLDCRQALRLGDSNSVNIAINRSRREELSCHDLRGFGLDLAAVAKELDVYESAQIDSFGT
jgi:hypothetical protein